MGSLLLGETLCPCTSLGEDESSCGGRYRGGDPTYGCVRGKEGDVRKPLVQLCGRWKGDEEDECVPLDGNDVGCPPLLDEEDGNDLIGSASGLPT